MNEKNVNPSIISGTVNEIIGKVKETTGKVFKSKSMETKGHMQKEMGAAEVEAAKRKKAEKKRRKQERRSTQPGVVTEPSTMNREQGYNIDDSTRPAQNVTITPSDSISHN